jgi:hypothetical protein
MKNAFRLVLVLVVVLMLVSTLTAFGNGDRLPTGGSIGVQAGELAYTVLTAILTLLRTTMGNL